MNEHYYHAGAIKRNVVGETVVDWSNKTRRTRGAAEMEARKISKEKEALLGNAWCGIVEWWDKSHGLRPGQDVAIGAAQCVDGTWFDVD